MSSSGSQSLREKATQVTENTQIEQGTPGTESAVKRFNIGILRNW